MKLATFRRGGVHPDDKKRLSKDRKIERLPFPSELIISMSQHLGAPATPVKKKGDTVRKGEVIATASSYVSSPVHSPADGVVVDVRKVRVPSGAVADALVIKCDETQSDPFQEEFDWKKESPEALLETVKEMGIVGMGGATFPTSVKLSIPMGKKADALIINAVECEPYLTSDYRVMMERPDEVLEGVMAASRIVSPDQIIIGIEANKEDAAQLLSSRIEAKGYPIKVQLLKMKYPQGDEKQLIKATLNREVPSGKLPLDVGAVVCNVGTAYAIYEAVRFQTSRRTSSPRSARSSPTSSPSQEEPRRISYHLSQAAR